MVYSSQRFCQSLPGGYKDGDKEGTQKPVSKIVTTIRQNSAV